MTTLIRQIAISAAAIALAAVMVGKASAEVITFDAQPIGGFTMFTEGSFTITAINGNPGDVPTIMNVGGTNVVVDGNPADPFGTGFRVTQTDGGLFTLNSIDVANLDNSGDTPVVCGGGFRIVLTDNIGDCAPYGPGSSTFTTVSPSGFAGISELDVNLVSLSVPGLDFAVDNINVTSATPEPSTLAMVLAGLAGLGISARRRRTRP